MQTAQYSLPSKITAATAGSVVVAHPIDAGFNVADVQCLQAPVCGCPTPT